MDFPYGKCECGPEYNCKVHGAMGDGPAAYEITRNGKRLKVCTRCDLGSDENKTLLIRLQDDAAPFIEWDALGAMCLAADLDKPAQPE